MDDNQVRLSPLTGSQQIRLELRSRPGRYLSVDQLCALTGMRAVEVRNAIEVLTRQGKILRRVPPSLARSDSRQAYGWKA